MKSRISEKIFILIYLINFIATPSCLAFFPSFSKFFNKKPTVLSFNTERPRLDEYENILGYKNKEYLLLYGYKKVWLADMNGKSIREWDTSIKRAQLLPSCNLMVIDDHENSIIAKKNYNGEILWEYQAPGITHHDFEFSDKGTLSFFYRTSVPDDIKLTNLCSNDEVIADAIIEINKSGEKKFEWFFHEHYETELNADKCTEARREWLAKSNFAPNLMDWMHPNSLNILKNNKWYKKGYQEFTPGNIIITSHHLNMVFIINKADGKTVWIYKGNDINLDGPHEAKMIPEGYPGAGNILIFDNGVSRKYSRILEINPITKKTIWSYSSPINFYNKWAGSQQRLKNGDTFISDDNSGRAFIVNKKGKIKWQFLTPDGEETKRSKLYLKKDFAHCLSEL